MPSEVELRVNRRLTLAFIAYDQRDVTFQRAVDVPTNAGGYVRGEPFDVVTQIGRFLSREAESAPITYDVDGVDVAATYVIVMPWDADVLEGDELTHEGHPLRVVWVHDRNGYEVKAELASRQ